MRKSRIPFSSQCIPGRASVHPKCIPLFLGESLRQPQTLVDSRPVFRSRANVASQLVGTLRPNCCASRFRSCYFDGVSGAKDGGWYFAKMSCFACSSVISPAATLSRIAMLSGGTRSPSVRTEAIASASASLGVSCIPMAAACLGLER